MQCTQKKQGDFMDRKVFFGGSFDPPHPGHLGVARAALHSGRCSHVVWFPGFLPPHKYSARRAPFADRMEMVKLLIAGEKDMSVSDFENRLQLTPSYTIDVLRRLHQETGEKYILLIGADSLLALHTWHKAPELISEFELLTYPRINAEVTLEKLCAYWDEKTAEKLLHSMIGGDFFEISSSKVRFSMEKKQFQRHIIDSGILSAQVAEYIKEKKLYI